MKKIPVSPETIQNIVDDYNNTHIGSPTLSKKYGLPKSRVLKILKENGCQVGSSGRKYMGGKSESDKRYYKRNKDKILSRYKNWANENKDKLKDYHAEWRKNNEDYKGYKRLYEKELKDKNPQYKLNQYFRREMNISLKERNAKKTSPYFDALGYTPEELKTHLESLFTKGMSWDNYGEWHIDHIIPLSKYQYTSTNDLSFKECWSLENLQPLWSKDNLSKRDRIVAHQYIIRKESEKSEKETLPFNIDDVSLKNAKIKVIDRKTTKPIIEKYEWLGYLPKYCNYYFGLYFTINGKDHLGGVVALQPEYGENMGVWNKYGYTGKIIQLSRGVCLWWTPKNSASFMISKVCDWLKKNTHYKVITATTDPHAGEIGTIYQALNWKYVGVFGGNLTKSGKERIRYGYIIDGKIYNQRHIRSKIGTAKKDVVLEHYPDVKIIDLGRKRRYFHFLGNKRENKQLVKSIQDMIRPYPKR